MGKEKLTFEQALETLEKTVAEIEGGEVALEESIEKYADGIQLIQQCRAILDKAERKIQLLSKGERESLTLAGELPEPEEG